MTYIYDIEVFSNCFVVSFININAKGIDKYIEADIQNNLNDTKDALNIMNVKTFIVFNETNNIKALYDFICSKSTGVLIGFNNNKYDNLILDYIIHEQLYLLDETDIITNSIKKCSDNLINYQGNTRKDFNIPYSNKYFSIDLMSLNYLDRLRISLKQVSISLNWYRVEDLTFPKITLEESNKYYNGFTNINTFDRYITNTILKSVIYYNINDVLITQKLYNYSLPELQQRIVISNKYKVNVISSSRSKVADKLISKFYESATGLKYWDYYNRKTYRNIIKFIDIIDNNIKFKTKQFNILLDSLKHTNFKVGHDKFSELILYKGTAYNMATGGLHSVDSGGIYTNKHYSIIDVDVNSFYPAVLINRKVKPEHIANVFIDLVKMLMNLRLEAKQSNDNSTADILKITINAIYGKLGFEYGFLYDLKAMYTITINGQLYLLNLIEDLEESGIHVISANTDGIVSTIYDNQIDKYYKICNVWSKRFNFGLSYTKYTKYIRLNVNSYITIKEDGDVKTKNDFLTTIKIDKGYYAPAIAKTLYEYYVNDNINIEKVIKTFHIYDYCISIKVGSQFKTEYHTIKNGKLNIEILQKNNRYYVSNKGGIMLKHNGLKFINVIKGYYITIFNTFYYSNNYDINYNFYIKKVRTIINEINKNTTKSIKKHGGNLFNT